MNFGEAMKAEANITRTENGAVAYKSTGVSKVLDLFAIVGALRTRKDYEIVSMFRAAMDENPLLAIRMMFYAGDIREGLGERRTFNIMLKEAAYHYPKTLADNIGYVPEFNRWDSLFSLIGTPVEDAVVSLIKEQLKEDTENAKAGKSISLMAKWLKKPNDTSLAGRKIARWVALQLGMTERSYRKAVSFLRAKLNLVETSMSKQEWDKITYSQVPSRAMLKYRRAFKNHDESGKFATYLDGLKKGTEKINAGVLYPYDLVEKYTDQLNSYSYWSSRSGIQPDEVIEAQWKALPNYISGEHNVLVMADTSGSMHGHPIAVALGLAIYFAERNIGPYKDQFMNFSTNPKFISLKGSTLAEKVANAEPAQWDGSTDLYKAIKEILRVAVQNKITPDQMPKALVIISDMEIDGHVNSNWGFYETVRGEFAQNGYEIPSIVFWNVESRKDTFLVDGNRKGVTLVSGASASTFKNVLEALTCTPYEAMVKILNSERYAKIELSEV